jgi:hypothetical protein
LKRTCQQAEAHRSHRLPLHDPCFHVNTQLPYRHRIEFNTYNFVYPELPWADCWSLTPMLCLKIFGSHVQALAPLLSAYPVIYEENTVVRLHLSLFLYSWKVVMQKCCPKNIL